MGTAVAWGWGEAIARAPTLVALLGMCLGFATSAGLFAGCGKDESGARLDQRGDGSGVLPSDALPGPRSDAEDATSVADGSVETDGNDAAEVSPDGDDGDAGHGDADSLDVDGGVLGDGQECQADAQCESGHCLISRQGRRCAPRCDSAPCPSGLECVGIAAPLGDRVCVDPAATACLPCTSHSSCNLGAAAGLDGLDGNNRCVGIGDGRFCAIACGAGLPGCGEGFECRDELCIPLDETCRCSPYAASVGAETTCQCTGVRRCEAAGELPSACDAAEPGPESCNGRDDDCNGLTDDAVACGDYACGGETGCSSACESSSDCRPGLGCDVDDVDGDGNRNECVATGDNGTICGADRECASGYCGGGYCCQRGAGPAVACCAVDADCAGLDAAATCTSQSVAGCLGQKVVGRCEGSVCMQRTAPAPEACVGRVCRPATCIPGGTGVSSVHDGAHLCDVEGACVATADDVCDDGLACTTDNCGANGCEAAPRNGVTESACYTFAADTRGVGLCKDGVTVCAGGVATGCQGERGPVAEVCNAKDDDCDGRVDEDTEVSCFPYLCGGASGCRTSCESDTQCAAGNYCSNGSCVGAGLDGASCQSDSQCASEHCSQGVCCEGGLCCVNNAQCAMLNADTCESAEANGCLGFRLEGTCVEGNVCAPIASLDFEACAGEGCSAPRCDGGAVVPGGACSATGQCNVGAPVGCAPYACREGACLTSCAGNADCAVGTCVSGQCKNLPNGAVCTNDVQCLAGRCNNGFCCASGTCCGGNSDCAGLTEPAICAAPGTCGGTQRVGICGGDASCQLQTVAAPGACLGVTCSAPRCVNLSGLGVVLEGVERKTCDALGACNAAIKDCRDFPDASFCTDTSDLYAACQGCSPRRATCVVFDNPCFCE